MRLLITGGCGFIGHHFVKLMIGSQNVEHIIVMDAMTYAADSLRVPQSNRCYVVYGNVRDDARVAGIIRKHKLDTVVHLAAETHVDRSITGPDAFVMTNVLGTHNVIAACLKHQVRKLVVVSTDEVYGSMQPDQVATEETPIRPSSVYSATKAAGDIMALAEFRTHGLPVCITRGTNTYGAGQYREKLIPMAVSKIMVGEPIPIYGDGRQVRDWMHVSDHCDGIAAVLDRGVPGQIYNLGAEHPMTNLEMVEAVQAEVYRQKRIPSKRVYVADRLGHDTRYAVSAQKALTQLGWIAKRRVLDLSDTIVLP